MTAEELKSRIVAAIPGAQVEAADLKGGDHFDVTVISDRFEGRPVVARHRMVYEALGDAMRSEIHALAIQTLTPDQHRQVSAGTDRS